MLHCCLKRVQKMGSDGADVTCCGRLSQIRTVLCVVVVVVVAGK